MLDLTFDVWKMQVAWRGADLHHSLRRSVSILASATTALQKSF